MPHTERAIFDLRRAVSVVIREGDRLTLVCSVEGLRDDVLAACGQLAGSAPLLALSEHRLASLAVEAPATVSYLAVPADSRAQDLMRLACARGVMLPADSELRAADASGAAAVAMLKRAQLVPTAVCFEVTDAQRDAVLARVAVGEWLLVEAATTLAHCDHTPSELVQVSDARVPLPGLGDCQFVLFREPAGFHEHVAILIGERSDWRDPTPVRLHSACLTGDIFGSQRCDCGQQLRRGMAAIHAGGGGILLYLAQEGRGIGLGNKFRAYQLQDQGLDTIDADQVIGFSKDERDFRTAQAMLAALDVQRITLLTNNPAKIDALRAAGIDVVSRQAIYGEITPQNARYLSTKATRHGHLLRDLLDEQDEPMAAGISHDPQELD